MIKEVKVMDIRTLKITFLEEYIKLKNERIIKKLSEVLKSEKKKEKGKRKSVFDFLGVLKKEEAAKMKSAIEEGCEQVDKDGW